MSREFPDKYRGNYNSVEFELDTKYAPYLDSSIKDPKGILSDYEKINNSAKVKIESDDAYYREVFGLYSNVLNANGSNLLDPYMAYMTHFNKLQRQFVDPPYSGKTYIFITRPDLNFWSDPTGITNVENVDLFNYFSKMNIGISVMPWLMYPHNLEMEFKAGTLHYRSIRDRIGSIKINNNSKDTDLKNDAFTPFIPILSNFCTSSSGGQDLTLDTEETEGDLHGNKLVYAKGADSSFAPGEITLEFSDIYGSPILHMMNLWTHYIHYLTKGIVNTWERYIQYRIIDYTCSIYIFECDRDNSTILRWAKYTGCFPKSLPIGNIQHNLDTAPDKLRQLSIPFVYNRYEPMKPAVLTDFNFLMNKFLLDDNKINKERIVNLGSAPSKLILNYKDTPIMDILNRDPAIIKPVHKENSNLVDNDTNYYDNKFWGSLPYVMNHKLVWIEPKAWFDNFTIISRLKNQSEIKYREELEAALSENGLTTNVSN